MLKRQESSLSSSSRRHTPAYASKPSPENRHAKAIGCMSGIFQLFSKYQGSNRRITFGRKREKLKPPSPAKGKKTTHAAEENKVEHRNFDFRSPTIQTEIRRPSATVVTVPENPRTPPSPSLVARLMGLEDFGASDSTRKLASAGAREDHATEKRRLLLQALEKCNEDLETLKRIIKAVQTTNECVRTPLPELDSRMILPGGGNTLDAPVNIPAKDIVESTRSPLGSFAGATHGTHMHKATRGKKPCEDDELMAKFLSKSSIVESSLHRRQHAAAAAIAPPWCGRAMAKSHVEDVCGEIGPGERREIGRIGWVLQDRICRELIEEVVGELKHRSVYSLPFDSCKRKLCF